MSTLRPIEIVFKAVDLMTRQTTKMTQGLHTMSQAASRSGMAISAAFTLPTMLAGTSLILQAKNTSEAFNTMRANTKLGSVSYNELRRSAQQFAATSLKSNAEVMESMVELGRAGKDTQGILEMYQGVVNLSIAGGGETGATATMLTNFMNIFDIVDSRAEGTADLLAATFSNSAQNIEELQQAIQHGANPASTMGMEPKEFLAMTATLANLGIRSSRVGAQMKSVMSSMINPATYQGIEGMQLTDSQGNFKGTLDIFKQLSSAMSGMTEQKRAETLLNLYKRIGITGASGLVANTEQWEKFGNILDQADGSVRRMTDEMGVGLYGAFISVANAWGAISEKMLGREGTAAEVLLRKLSSILLKISELDTSSLNALAVAAIALAVAGPSLIAVSQVLTGLASLPAITGAITGMLGTTAAAGTGAAVTATAGAGAGAAAGTAGISASLATIAGILSGPVGWALLAIAALVAVMVAGWNGAMNIFGAIKDKWDELMGRLNPLVGSFLSLKAAWDDMITVWKPILEPIGTALKALAGVLTFLLLSPLISILTAIYFLLLLATRLMQGVGNVITSIDKGLMAVLDKVTFGKASEWREDSIQSGRRFNSPDFTLPTSSDMATTNSPSDEEDRTIRIEAPEGWNVGVTGSMFSVENFNVGMI